jgi:hypothetical protein
MLGGMPLGASVCCACCVWCPAPHAHTHTHTHTHARARARIAHPLAAFTATLTHWASASSAMRRLLCSTRTGARRRCGGRQALMCRRLRRCRSCRTSSSCASSRVRRGLGARARAWGCWRGCRVPVCSLLACAHVGVWLVPLGGVAHGAATHTHTRARARTRTAGLPSNAASASHTPCRPTELPGLLKAVKRYSAAACMLQTLPQKVR